MNQKKESISRNLFWKMENGVLEILGKGEMPDFSGDVTAPWLQADSCITSVWIQEGVTSIGANAFRNCRSLQEVYLAESVRYIGGSAFEGCTALEYIDLTEYAHIAHIYDHEEKKSREAELIRRSMHPDYRIVAGRRAFFGTPWAKQEYGEFWIQDGVLLEYLGERECVTVPEEVRKIGQMAFAGCGLKSVKLPFGLEVIDSFAFLNNALTDVTLPLGLKQIGRSAFAGNLSLEHVLFEANDMQLEKDIFRDCSPELRLESGAWRTAQRYARRCGIHFKNYRPKERFEKVSLRRLLAAGEAPGTWLMDRIKCRNVLLRVLTDEEERCLRAVWSYSWSAKDRCGFRYVLYPCLAGQDRTEAGREDCGYYFTKEEMLESLTSDTAACSGMQAEEWYFSGDWKNVSGPLERAFAAYWLQMHPEYHVEGGLL